MYLTAFLIIGGIIFLVLFFHYVPFFLWLSAKVSGVNISLVQLFLMRIRNVPPYIIVPGMIEAHKAGLQNITRDELEAHYLAGGHVERVVHALVSASKANIELPFQPEDYVHRIGRTGRAGRNGLAITLFSVDDSLLLEELESLLDRRLPQQWFPGFEPDLTRSAPAPRRHGKAAEKQRAKKRAFGSKGKR